MVAAAQVGAHNEKRSSYGHSLVIDPWGRIILDMNEKIGYDIVEIDQTETEKVRRSMPVFDHFRHDIY